MKIEIKTDRLIVPVVHLLNGMLIYSTISFLNIKTTYIRKHNRNNTTMVIKF